MLHSLSGLVLRDTARLSQRYPPIARYGVFGVPTWPSGCDTPSPFSEHFPLGEHAKWRCDTPPLKRAISAILARCPLKTRHMGAMPRSATLSRKGIGGLSRIGPLRAQQAFPISLSLGKSCSMTTENGQRSFLGSPPCADLIHSICQLFSSFHNIMCRPESNKFSKKKKNLGHSG